MLVDYILNIPYLFDLLEQALWMITVYICYHMYGMVFALIRAILIYRVAPLFYTPPFYRYVNRWTVVTGGTDGIGKAYTIELAKRNFKKFILIGRNPTKLNDMKRLLEELYGAQVETFLFNFENGNYEKLREYINSIENIGFVLNSVGVGREKMERYGENPAADDTIFKVNGFGATQLLSMVLEPMSRSGGGQIISVSSCLGYDPVRYLAAYSSTKSLVNYVSRCIDDEYDNINVQVLTPCVVATAMTQYNDAKSLNWIAKQLYVTTPETLAYEAVRTIGLVRYTSGTLMHELQLVGLHLPEFLRRFILNTIINMENRRIARLAEKKRSLINGNNYGGVAA